MADEIRVTQDDDVLSGTHTRGAQLDDPAQVEAIIPPDSTGSTYAPDPEMARAEIEQTRARMSETIDEIEEALVRRKEQIQDKLDVLSPVRDRPLPSAGIALGAGVLLGFLTGGDDDEDEYDYDDDREREWAVRYTDRDDVRYWRERAHTWESRARRLRDFARDQKEEIQDVQESWGEARAAELDRRRARAEDWDDDDDYDDYDDKGTIRSAIDQLHDNIVGGLTGFLSNAFHQITSGESTSQRT